MTQRKLQEGNEEFKGVHCAEAYHDVHIHCTQSNSHILKRAPREVLSQIYAWSLCISDLDKWIRMRCVQAFLISSFQSQNSGKELTTNRFFSTSVLLWTTNDHDTNHYIKVRGIVNYILFGKIHFPLWTLQIICGDLAVIIDRWGLWGFCIDLK